VRAEAEVGLERRTVQGERLVTPIDRDLHRELVRPESEAQDGTARIAGEPQRQVAHGTQDDVDFCPLGARAFPERRVNGTPAHRAFRTSTRTWASVSVSRAGSTPGSSTYDGIRSSPAVPAV
jgi:hypothetical protein